MSKARLSPVGSGRAVVLMLFWSARRRYKLRRAVKRARLPTGIGGS